MYVQKRNYTMYSATQVDTSWSEVICSYENALTNDMREIYGFLRLASRLANPFGHPSQARTQVLVLQTCVDLRRLASWFGQGIRTECYDWLFKHFVNPLEAF